MQAWYLLQTKSRQESLAKLNLERQGYTVYLPVIRAKRRKREKNSVKLAPMFPLYLFIRLQEGVDNWAAIRSTIGVSGLVRFGQIAARVPDGLIAGLKASEDDQGIQILPEPKFMPGDHVRVAEGVFQGYEAVVYAKSSSERVVVLLKVIQNHLKVELDSQALEPFSG